MPLLTLVRGLPGSGKSTLARQLAAELNARHLEADDYFVNRAGEYCFEPTKLSKAHLWCQRQTAQTLAKRNVVVANTFVELWELEIYFAIAKRCQAEVQVKTCTQQFRSVHNVPDATLLKMRSRWQPYPLEEVW